MQQDLPTYLELDVDVGRALFGHWWPVERLEGWVCENRIGLSVSVATRDPFKNVKTSDQVELVRVGRDHVVGGQVDPCIRL